MEASRKDKTDMPFREFPHDLFVASTNIACTVHTPVFEREERYIPLPPPLNANKETTLKILHDPYLISRRLWAVYRLSSSESQSESTVLILKRDPVVTKITFTNHDDGVSVLEQSVTGVSVLLRWSVTEEDYSGGKKEERDLVDGFRQPRYVLEEKFTIRGSRFIWWISTAFQSSHLTTRCLMDFLKKVAAEETHKAEAHSNDNLPLTDGKSE